MRVLLALLMLTMPLAAAKRPTTAQLQAQVKKLTEERDTLKARLAALGDIQEQLVAAQQARDQAKSDAEAARKEVDQLKTTLKENRSGGDSLVKDLHAALKEADSAKEELARIKTENEHLRQQASATPQEGDLVMLSKDIQPARPMNLNRSTPRVKSTGLFSPRPKGVVVVNVLISEKGEVLDARLIQGLPGDTPEAKEANEACVESAKNLVFDPATSKDGSTRFKVWQGVGFYLD
jgi:chromosome segregation ATPase